MSVNKAKRSTMGPEETKLRLLESGLELFALNGFKAVTTRQLSAHAGVNQAAIPYHFGGKEGLYLAVAKRIVATMDGVLTFAMQQNDCFKTPASASREQLAAMLVIIIRALAGRMSANQDLNQERAFIIREYASPGKAFQVIYKGGVERMHILVTEVVAAAMGMDPNSEEAKIHAHTVVGQVMGFAAGKIVLCTRLGIETYDDEVAEKIASATARMALRATGLEQDFNPELCKGAF